MVLAGARRLRVPVSGHPSGPRPFGAVGHPPFDGACDRPRGPHFEAAGACRRVRRPLGGNCGRRAGPRPGSVSDLLSKPAPQIRLPTPLWGGALVLAGGPRRQHPGAVHPVAVVEVSDVADGGEPAHLSGRPSVVQVADERGQAAALRDARRPRRVGATPTALGARGRSSLRAKVDTVTSPVPCGTRNGSRNPSFVEPEPAGPIPFPTRTRDKWPGKLLNMDPRDGPGDDQALDL